MKKSELKSYIQEEIESILKEESTLNEENIGLADLEEMGYEAGEKAFEMAYNSMGFRNVPDFKAYKVGFIQGFVDQAGAYSLNESEDLNEMAKIAGDLKSSIEKVMSDNPDIETKELKKLIQNNTDVKTALGDAKLYDTQLAKFIASAKGERTVGQRGRKADPNTIKKPKSPTGSVGRPKQEKKKDAAITTSKLGGKKYYTKQTKKQEDGEGPSDSELRSLAKSDKTTRGKDKALEKQQKTKAVKAFLDKMKKDGIVDNANRILDKDAYAKAWTSEKEDILAGKYLKEASEEEVNNQKELNKELEKTAQLSKQVGLDEEKKK